MFGIMHIVLIPDLSDIIFVVLPAPDHAARPRTSSRRVRAAPARTSRASGSEASTAQSGEVAAP